MAFIPIEDPKDLRLGLFIKIKGSWFSHPFSKNTFKIKFEKDLATLRGLTKVQLLYDPERSDPETVTEAVLEESLSHPVVRSTSEVRTSGGLERIALAEPPPPTHIVMNETPESRREAFLTRRKILQENGSDLPGGVATEQAHVSGITHWPRQSHRKSL